MNTLIRKEVRLILPAWIAAVLLATLPVWVLWPGEHGVLLPTPGVSVYGPFVLGALVLSVVPFGQELNLGTFAVLLAQPTSRRRLWLAKIGVLAVALGLVYVALFVSSQIRMDGVISTLKETVWRNAFQGRADPAISRAIAETRHTAMAESLLIGGVAVLAAFAGGLWTTLLFRQVSAALCFTFFVPMSLVLLAGKLVGDFSLGTSLGILTALLGLYSIAGFLWARRLFARAQDTQWTGGVILLPSWRKTKAQTRSGRLTHKRRGFRALLLKEIQSQQVNLLLAAGILFLHIITLIVRQMYASYFATHQSVAMLWETFPLLWLVMPFLVGAVAIAEERKLGTFEASLCLPVSRRLQFAVKFALVLVLGILLGGVMPLTIEWVGGRLGPQALAVAFPLSGTQSESQVLLMLCAVAGASLLALYGSTLTRGTIQALAAGVLACVVAGLGMFAAGHVENLGALDIDLWRGPLIAMIGLPVMVTAVVALAYTNYKRVDRARRIWVRNILVLFLAAGLSALATTMVYHRAWEAWLPVEPEHPFSARFENFSLQGNLPGASRLHASGSTIAYLLRDGRLWLRQRPMRPLTADDHRFFARAAGRLESGWLPGRNWRDVAVGGTRCFAIQKDGSLWDLSQVRFGNRGAEFEPRPFGESGDWERISCGGGEHFTALKSDGTLWEWGYVPLVSGTNITVRQIPQPTQIGREDDWTALCDTGEKVVALKADESVWRWGWLHTLDTNKVMVSSYASEPQRWLNFPGDRAVSLSASGNSIALVTEHGALWIGGDLPSWLLGPGRAATYRGEIVRYGEDADWSQVAFVGWTLVALKRDGSLWGWDPARLMPNGVHFPTTLSRYNDWVACCPLGGSFLALASNGSLCRWKNGLPDSRFERQESLTMPSRILATKVADLWK